MSNLNIKERREGILASLPDECRKAIQHIKTCPICARAFIALGEFAEKQGYDFKIIKPKE